MLRAASVDADPTVLAAAVRTSPAVLGLLAGGWMRVVALDEGRVVDIAEVLAAADASTDRASGTPSGIA